MRDFDYTLEAKWCVNSETGEQILIDSYTGMVIARKNEKGEIVDAYTRN